MHRKCISRPSTLSLRLRNNSFQQQKDRHEGAGSRPRNQELFVCAGALFEQGNSDMDTTETENKAGTSVPIPPLKSRRLNGKPYQRLAVVDNQIVALSEMLESERFEEFRRARPEVLMHFIRNGGRKVVDVYRLLCVEIVRRIAGRVRK